MPSHFSARLPRKNAVVLGIDIGGTGIGAGLFDVIDGKISETPFWELKESPDSTKKGVDTIRGRAEHIEQVATIIAQASAQVPDNKYLAGVGIGSPGRFDPATGKIKAGTNPNIGKTIHEMDGVNLEEAYTQAIEQKMGLFPPIVVKNDGNAMLAGIMDAIQTSKAGELFDQDGQPMTATKFGGPQGKKVAVFGIGTGIGHAIVQTGQQGEVQDFITDGHASKLWVDVEPADLAFLHEKLAAINVRINGTNKNMFDPTKHLEHIAIQENRAKPGQVRAEDLFRAPVINALAGLTKLDVAAGKGRDPEEENLAKALDFAGKYMARTIAVIKSGEGVDMVPENAWSDTDRKLASETNIYIVGGDFGRNPVGAALIGAAKKEIATNEDMASIRDIKLVQYTGKPVATRAAATMIPAKNYMSERMMVAA